MSVTGCVAIGRGAYVVPFNATEEEKAQLAAAHRKANPDLYVEPCDLCGQEWLGRVEVETDVFFCSPCAAGLPTRKGD